MTENQKIAILGISHSKKKQAWGQPSIFNYQSYDIQDGPSYTQDASMQTPDVLNLLDSSAELPIKNSPEE